MENFRSEQRIKKKKWLIYEWNKNASYIFYFYRLQKNDQLFRNFGKSFKLTPNIKVFLEKSTNTFNLPIGEKKNCNLLIPGPKLE